jgi:hypothetical protein
VEIHKPRPIQNWRELATEVGVIVVGIVIALSGEQLLQSLEWREKISRAEEQIRVEMADDDGPEVFQRLALGDCIDSGLAQIRASVERGDSRAAVIGAIANVDIPHHTYESFAYNAAAASGVLARLSAERLNLWNFLYAPMPVLDRITEREYFDAAALHAIRNSGGPLSEAEQLRTLDAVENLKLDNHDILSRAELAKEAFKMMDIKLQKLRVKQMLDELAAMPGASACVEKLRTMSSGYEP